MRFPALFRSDVCTLMTMVASIMVLTAVISFFADGQVGALACVLWVVTFAIWTVLLAIYLYASWRSDQ